MNPDYKHPKLVSYQVRLQPRNLLFLYLHVFIYLPTREVSNAMRIAYLLTMDGILPVKSMIVEGLDSSNPASIMKSTLPVIAGDIF